MHIASHDVMQLLRKDVCRLSEGLWKSHGKLSKEGSLAGVPKAELSFFQFARSYEGRNIWTTDSKRSQGPSQIIQCSVSGNAVGISYLMQRDLNQETFFCAFMQEDTNLTREQLSRPSCAWTKDTSPGPHMPPVLEVSVSQSCKPGFREKELDFERV